MHGADPSPSGTVDAGAAASRQATARADVVGGGLWSLLGLATAVGAWRMDRLEAQDINPYTVPGLVPGLLGAAMVFFGGLMLLRGARAGGLASSGARPARWDQWRRVGIVLVLCIGFAVGLVGHGLPFWLAATLFVAVTIAVLDYPDWAASGRVGRGLAKAATIGIGAGVIVTVVFEKFFLVRLP